MCHPVKVTAGAVLAGMLCTRAGFTAAAVIGSGGVLYAIAGSALHAGLIMVLAAGWAITGITLLAMRAHPARRVVYRPAPSRPAVRATARVLVAAPARQLLPAAPRNPRGLSCAETSTRAL